jgi:hypothetical protein
MNWLWLWWEKMMTNEASYSQKMSGKTRSGKTYTQEVVSQPTVQSNIKAKVDPSSPSGIREVKPRDKS